jgi:hypothetical protein
MDKSSPAETDAPVPANLLASLLIERALTTSRADERPERLTLKIYGVMATTTLLTFATLVTGYQLFFPHQLFA